MPHRFTVPTLALAVAAAGLLASGCDTPGRRIDISETTEAELDSERVLPTALMEFSDQAPRRLTQSLASVPVIRDTPGPVTVFLGDIDNQTGVVSSSEFELAMSRMRNRLINSNIAGSKINWVERRARMQNLAQRERVASGDYLADPADYDPQTTYVLNGDFYRIARGRTNQYYLQFNLVHFGSNQIVWSDDFDVKQVRGE